MGQRDGRLFLFRFRFCQFSTFIRLAPPACTHLQPTPIPIGFAAHMGARGTSSRTPVRKSVRHYSYPNGRYPILLPARSSAIEAIPFSSEPQIFPHIRPLALGRQRRAGRYKEAEIERADEHPEPEPDFDLGARVRVARPQRRGRREEDCDCVPHLPREETQVSTEDFWSQIHCAESELTRDSGAMGHGRSATTARGGTRTHASTTPSCAGEDQGRRTRRRKARVDWGTITAPRRPMRCRHRRRGSNTEAGSSCRPRGARS